MAEHGSVDPGDGAEELEGAVPDKGLRESMLSAEVSVPPVKVLLEPPADPGRGEQVELRWVANGWCMPSGQGWQACAATSEAAVMNVSAPHAGVCSTHRVRACAGAGW